MILIDTNPLLRLILKDNLNQFNRIVKLLKTEDGLVVAQVIFELEYVLRKVYGLSKTEIGKCLNKLLLTKKLMIEEKIVLEEAFRLYVGKNVDLVDAYLWIRAKELGTTVFSFDRDFKRLGSRVK
jgi:predicted nucleic-acid-binding protein